MPAMGLRTNSGRKRARKRKLRAVPLSVRRVMISAEAMTLNQSPNWEMTLPSHRLRKFRLWRSRSRYSFMRDEF